MRARAYTHTHTHTHTRTDTHTHTHARTHTRTHARTAQIHTLLMMDWLDIYKKVTTDSHNTKPATINRRAGLVE